MKRLAILLFALAIPMQAFALTAKDVLSLVAMPLAVAAVADVTHVPQDQLAALATALNDANVPPDQFVQVLRYSPPALVPATGQPTLVQYVQTQTANGLTGPALVTAIDQQLPVYGVTPVVNVDVPATTLVQQSDYIPTQVLAQLGGTADPLALLTMPLAVAAVSDLTGVPQDQLANLVATLNEANVAPTQFVQVLRYAPVALVTQVPQQPTFVQYVQQQQAQGITGPALVTVIDQQLPNYGIAPQTLAAPLPSPQAVVVDRNYFPPMVRERVARARGNPFGGPPGQLKKAEGLQTGAEVVHGYQPGRQIEQPVVQRPVMAERHHGNPHGMPPGQARRVEQLPPPMMSGSMPPQAAHVPPGQAKKMARPPVVVAPQAAPAPGPPAGMPPGLAKKERGGGPPAGMPPGQAKKGGEGHGHGKD